MSLLFPSYISALCSALNCFVGFCLCSNSVCGCTNGTAHAEVRRQLTGDSSLPAPMWVLKIERRPSAWQHASPSTEGAVS